VMTSWVRPSAEVISHSVAVTSRSTGAEART
jgi:hypothetical protein